MWPRSLPTSRPSHTCLAIVKARYVIVKFLKAVSSLAGLIVSPPSNMEDATCLICLELSALAAEMPGHNEARVVNEWQSTRSGRDTMAQTEQAARLTCSPLTVLTGSVLALASRGRLFAFEFKFDFEDEGEDAPLCTHR